MYSCEQVIAELASYMDDQITAELRRELERHLAHCQICRVIYDSTRKTLRIVTESRSFDLPEGVSNRLMTKIMTTVRSSRPRRAGNGRAPAATRRQPRARRSTKGGTPRVRRRRHSSSGEGGQ